MPKRANPTDMRPSFQADLESERLYRDHLLPRYIKVVHRQGDFIEIVPRLADSRRDVTPPSCRRSDPKPGRGCLMCTPAVTRGPSATQRRAQDGKF